MPQETNISHREKKNSVLIGLVETDEEVNYIVDNSRKYFVDTSALSVFKMTDFEYIKEFFKSIIKKDAKAPYFLCKFTDAKTNEIVGFVLFSIGSPWYNPKLTAISEELTVSLKKGYGIARSIAAYMAYCVKEGKADIASGASAQTNCAPEVANSYAKLGYDRYPTYYLVSEAIKTFDKE